MLRRLAFRVAAQNGSQTARVAPAVVHPGLISASSFHTKPSDTAETQRLIERWDACNEKYFGKYRDVENFPQPVQQEAHEPVRMAFVPKSMFDAFYAKTGVSGPYFTVGGLVVFLMSKEILVMDHQFFELLAFWAAVTFIVKKWGKSISSYFVDQAQQIDHKNFHEPIEKTRSAFAKAVSQIDSQIDQEARHQYVYEVQKENVDLQLEARYRERVAQVYDAVKRRLDYQVQLVNTKKRFEQQHMVNWIVDSVVKGITPKQEKDAITSCIANLKSLAKAQPAV